jgi:hypothetical protein
MLSRPQEPPKVTFEPGSIVVNAPPVTIQPAQVNVTTPGVTVTPEFKVSVYPDEGETETTIKYGNNGQVLGTTKRKRK